MTITLAPGTRLTDELGRTMTLNDPAYAEVIGFEGTTAILAFEDGEEYTAPRAELRRPRGEFAPRLTPGLRVDVDGEPAIVTGDVRPGEGRDLEVRMIFEHLHKPLADQTSVWPKL